VTVHGREFYEDLYRTRVWSGRPNPQLVAEVADLPPGTALDAGCGEGADAVWLAERGWRVTAVDFAAAALARGAEHAPGVDWVRADLTAWTPPARYDLVSAQFLHLPGAQRVPVFARLADAVAPGGTLLLVGHDSSDTAAGAHRPPEPDLFFTADEVAAGLDPGEWDVVVAESRARKTTHPEGRAMTVHDAVVRAVRRVG
jgi:SAM-dependent methyltransferase